MKWKAFVKLGDSVDPAPYYVQWAVWCWRKPIYIGLPLIILSIPLALVDVVLSVLNVLIRWGKE